MKKHLTFSLALFTFFCSTVTAQLPSYLPADGLVGWWPFNGNANDESGNGNDGVVNGATLTEDRFGVADAAYDFDRSIANEINVDASNDLNLIENITISLWVNLNSYGMQGESGYNHFINKSDQNNNHHFVFANNFDALYLYFAGGNNLFVTNNLPPLNQWSNIAVTYLYDGNSVSSYCKFYIDGLLVESFETAQNLNLTNDDIKIGTLGSASFNRVDGSLDDIAIYNRALTEQEIQNLYTGTNETVDTGDGAAPLPQGIPYQAAARDAQGQVIADASVNVRFSLHEGAVDGPVSYSETHALTTNSIGLFNTVFGNGTPEQSAFDSINWAATTKFLQVEIDLGDGYVDMGTTQLLSVPYAFRSDEAARIKNAGLPIFADNAAALAGGLGAGEMYRTASGDLKIVY